MPEKKLIDVLTTHLDQIPSKEGRSFARAHLLGQILADEDEGSQWGKERIIEKIELACKFAGLDY